MIGMKKTCEEIISQGVGGRAFVLHIYQNHACLFF